MAAAIRSACAAISAVLRPSIRSVGTSRSASASSRNSTSVASNAASVSLSTRTIRASGFLRIASIHRARPRMIPPCGPPISLSALRRDQVGPGRHRLGQRRLRLKTEPREVDQGAGAHVVDDGQPAVVAQADKFVQRHFGGEAEDLVVARMDAEDGGGVLGDRPLVVTEMGLVRRAHLDELHAGGGHDLGQAERAADLDQLPAGDDHLAAGRHGVEHDRRGGGVVVDHGGRLGAGQLPQQLFDPLVAPRPLAGGRVGLEQRIAGQFFGDLPHGPLGQDGPAQRRCAG